MAAHAADVPADSMDQGLHMSSPSMPGCPETSPSTPPKVHERRTSAHLTPRNDSLFSSPDEQNKTCEAATSPTAAKHRLSTASMASSLADSLSDYGGDSDFSSDNDSTCEMQCFQARVIRMLSPGKPSVIDIMRAEKPVFKRASRVVIRRPVSRPLISPIQARRQSFTSGPDILATQRTSYDTSDQRSRASTPSTPSLDDDEAASTRTYTTSPSSPVTPKSSFEQERRLFVAYRRESTATEAPAASIDEPIAKLRKPSRMRLFSRKTFPQNLNETKGLPYSQTTEAGSRLTLNVYDMETPRPWQTASEVSSPATSTSEPATGKHNGAKALWRGKLGIGRG